MEGIDPTPQEHGEQVLRRWEGRVFDLLEQLHQSAIKLGNIRLRLPPELYAAWCRHMEPMERMILTPLPDQPMRLTGWHTPWGPVEVVPDATAANGGELSLVLKTED